MKECMLFTFAKTFLALLVLNPRRKSKRSNLMSPNVTFNSLTEFVGIVYVIVYSIIYLKLYKIVTDHTKSEVLTELNVHNRDWFEISKTDSQGRVAEIIAFNLQNS